MKMQAQVPGASAIQLPAPTDSFQAAGAARVRTDRLAPEWPLATMGPETVSGLRFAPAVDQFADFHVLRSPRQS